jgi:glutamyl-tRNA synthetase
MIHQTVRVRFAPSPTGYLHIGGARTALFNHLFARQNNGVFVLRIEDTDRERSTPEAVQAILDGMRYLELDWDEGPEVGGEYGPYFQSERASLHQAMIDDLSARRRAYRCFCSKERLTGLREEQMAAKARVHYDRVCRDLAPEEAKRRADAGESFVMRFSVEPGSTVVHDMIRGDVVFQNDEIEDFIIARADGTCVYNLAVVGDDSGMKISHVIRGEDHLSNTPKQILLFEALDLPVPSYAHIPLILGPGRAKLSKRHGAVSVTEYQNLGYLPEAMTNFLARLGWSYDDKEEIFSRQDLLEKFSLEKVSKSGGMYDPQKLDHLGGHWLRLRAPEELLDRAIPFLLRDGLIAADDVEALRPRLARMVALERERMDRLDQISFKLQYYFNDIQELEPKAAKALRKSEGAVDILAAFADRLEGNFDPEDAGKLEDLARTFTEEKELKLKDLAQPARVVLTGRVATPPLFDVMACLGEDLCLQRLRDVERLVNLAEA